MQVSIIIPFIFYFLIVIGIGVYTTRFSSLRVSEFFLGGRQMGRFVVALSAAVSGRSAWLLLGFTGMAYAMGFSAVWAVAGYTLVEFLLFLYYALRILIIIIFLVFMVTYVSAQFVGGGKAFFTNFGLDQRWGLVLTAVIVLVYTILGGFLAVSYTDVFQAFVMLLALIGLPVYAVIQMGGWNEVSLATNSEKNKGHDHQGSKP